MFFYSFYFVLVCVGGEEVLFSWQLRTLSEENGHHFNAGGKALWLAFFVGTF